MKRAISISLGSSKRDKSVKINLGGEEILVERVGRIRSPLVEQVEHVPRGQRVTRRCVFFVKVIFQGVCCCACVAHYVSSPKFCG